MFPSTTDAKDAKLTPPPPPNAPSPLQPKKTYPKSFYMYYKRFTLQNPVCFATTKSVKSAKRNDNV